VLALIFLLVGILVIGGLTYAASNDISNSQNFKASRSLQFAASSATNLAIQNIRYAPLLSTSQTLNASPPSYCWGSSAPSQYTFNTYTLSSWCSTAWTPTSAQTRVVTISTCLSADLTGTPISASTCAASPLLQAVVAFDDYPAGLSSPTTGQCVVYCGSSMAVTSWVWKPVVPTVSGISVTSGLITGGTGLVVTGSGFVQGSTVNFVQENGGTPTSTNVVFQGTSPTVGGGGTTITVSSPAVTSGSTYYVTVTTPTGTSPFTSNAVFSYSPVAPVVISISPTSGAVVGGSAVNITGTGFFQGAIVTFVQESGGSIVSGGQSVQPTTVTVNSATSISVVSPAVTSATTFYVTVTTPGGTSAVTSSGIFTYILLVPTVMTVSPTTGTVQGGTTITITGTGFVTGATVSLSPVGGGAAIAATSVTVVGPGTLTAVTPKVSAPGQYYVNVTISGLGTSSNYPTYTYTSP